MARTDDVRKPERSRISLFSRIKAPTIKAHWARPGVISAVVMAISLTLTVIAFAIIFGMLR